MTMKNDVCRQRVHHFLKTGPLSRRADDWTHLTLWGGRHPDESRDPVSLVLETLDSGFRRNDGHSSTDINTRSVKCVQGSAQREGVGGGDKSSLFPYVVTPLNIQTTE